MDEAITEGTRPSRRCPYCDEPVGPSAARCPSCRRRLLGPDEIEDEDDEEYERRRRRRRIRREPDPGLGWLVPINLSGWAIASGYLGLLSCFPLVGVLFGVGAIVTGALALQAIRRDPEKGGLGRAIFGIVLGSLGTIGWVLALIVILFAKK